MEFFHAFDIRFLVDHLPVFSGPPSLGALYASVNGTLSAFVLLHDCPGLADPVLGHALAGHGLGAKRITRRSVIDDAAHALIRMLDRLCVCCGSACDRLLHAALGGRWGHGCAAGSSACSHVCLGSAHGASLDGCLYCRVIHAGSRWIRIVLFRLGNAGRRLLLLRLHSVGAVSSSCHTSSSRTN